MERRPADIPAGKRYNVENDKLEDVAGRVIFCLYAGRPVTFFSAVKKTAIKMHGVNDILQRFSKRLFNVNKSLDKLPCTDCMKFSRSCSVFSHQL